MPHILILDEWEAMLGQLHDYSFTIKSNIDNNLYHGQQLSQANAIQASVESLIEDINSAHRSGLEEKIGALESFLGI